MRTLLLAAAAVASVAATTVFAQPKIEDACLRAAELYFQVDGLEMSKVQSFPELSPPRVRMHVSGENLPDLGLDAIATLLGGKPAEQKRVPSVQVVCEFTNNAAPFELTHFDCASMACWPSDKRVEEIRILLQRERF